MKTQCPHCEHVQDYQPAAQQLRKRKHCTNHKCKKKFEVKPWVPPSPSPPAHGGLVPPEVNNHDDQDDHQVNNPQQALLVNLDDTMLRIVGQLGKGYSQATIAKQEKLTRAAINKRVKRLEDWGVIRVKPGTWPRTYEILPEIKKTTRRGLIAGVRLHKFRVRYNIVHQQPEFSTLVRCLSCTKMGKKGKSWHKYRTDHKYVNFEINMTSTPNIVCAFTAAGRSGQELKDNLWEKILEARDWLEARLRVVVSDPEIKKINEKDRPDLVLGYWTPEQFEAMKQAWNDKSDPDAVAEMSFNDFEQVDMLVDALTKHDENQHALETVQKELAVVKEQMAFETSDIRVDVKNEIQKLWGEVRELTTALGTLVREIKNLAQNGGALVP